MNTAIAPDTATLVSTGRLDIDDLAPAFSAEDLFGSPVDLESYRGSPVLLSFFRNSACALCNLRVHELIARYPDYHAGGLEVLVVFESTADSLRTYVGKQDAPFSIIADPNAELYALYGVESSEDKVAATMSMPDTVEVIGQAAAAGFELIQDPDANFLRMPADILIGADGTIIAAHYASFVWDHLPFATVEAALQVTAER